MDLCHVVCFDIFPGQNLLNSLLRDGNKDEKDGQFAITGANKISTIY